MKLVNVARFIQGSPPGQLEGSFERGYLTCKEEFLKEVINITEKDIAILLNKWAGLNHPFGIYEEDLFSLSRAIMRLLKK